MKKLQKITGLFLLIGFASILLLSCSNDNDGGNNSSEKRVTFKVVGSSGANITTVVYAIGTTTYPVTEINNSTWTSEEILVPAGTTTLSLAGNATGTSASSSIRLQIFVNGELKKEIAQSGTVMSTWTQYVFEFFPLN